MNLINVDFVNHFASLRFPRGLNLKLESDPFECKDLILGE